MRSRLWLAVALVSALSQSPAPAHAESAAAACPENDAAVCGRRAFEAGTRAFDAGDFRAARLAFEAAQGFKPHPVILYNLAVSRARLGEVVAAAAELRSVEADPAASGELRQRAAVERASAERQQARLELQSPAAGVVVEIDGAPVGDASSGDAPADVALDPGTHRVRVRTRDAVLYEQDLEFLPGERVALRIAQRSRAIDVVVVPAATSSAAPPPAGAARDRSSLRRLHPAWFWGGAGVTAALTGVFVWSALDTQSAFDDYERDLPELTQSQADARVASGHARERRTNWLLGGALGAAAATAVVGVWFTDFSGRRGEGARLELGPAGASLRGRF